MPGITVDSFPHSNDSIISVNDSVFSQCQIEQIMQIAENKQLQGFEHYYYVVCIVAFFMAIIAVTLICIAFMCIKKLNKNCECNKKSLMDIAEKTVSFEQQITVLGAELKKYEKKYVSLSSVPPMQSAKTQKNEQVKPQEVVVINPTRKQIPRFVEKYADFYVEGDAILVDQRDLSDNHAEGMFLVKIQNGASRALYTVNTFKQKAILEDVLGFARYVNLREIPSTYSSVKVLNEGELVKSGASWKIVKKMDVKLL